MSNLSIPSLTCASALLAELISEAHGSVGGPAAEALHHLETLEPGTSADAPGALMPSGLLAAGPMSLLAVPHAGRLAEQPVGTLHEADTSTLQDMAQAVPRHDISSERHGAAAGAFLLRGDDPHSAAHAALSTSRPEAAGAQPVARGVQVAPGPASLLHGQPTEFRASLAQAEPKDVARERSGASSQDEADQGHEPQEPWCVAEAEPSAHDPGRAPASGDAALFHQIVTALRSAQAAPSGACEALEELRRQRRVVIASPHGVHAGLRCAAHVDVLLPVAAGGRALRLVGEILWTQAPGARCDWLMAHLVKTQTQGGVRQLSPLPTELQARNIAVCLGTQVTPMVAWSQACLRVRDGTLLWRALEPQWSLRLFISTSPLCTHTVHPHPRYGAHHHAA